MKLAALGIALLFGTLAFASSRKAQAVHQDWPVPTCPITDPTCPM